MVERAPNEIWVVNHLSDSVSIVDPTASPPQVVRTLPVGDEPNDILVGGLLLRVVRRLGALSDPAGNGLMHPGGTRWTFLLR